MSGIVSRFRRVSRHVVVAFTALAGVAHAAPAFETSSPLAFLMDFESGTVLFEKNADQPGLSQSLSAGRETGGLARFSGWVPLGRSDPIQPLSQPFPKFATGSVNDALSFDIAQPSERLEELMGTRRISAPDEKHADARRPDLRA